jgi:hypothetical protein
MATGHYYTKPHLIHLNHVVTGDMNHRDNCSGQIQSGTLNIPGISPTSERADYQYLTFFSSHRSRSLAGDLRGRG